MAILRNYLRCSSCGAKVITRTAPGHSPSQQHKFPCPSCGVEIRFSLRKKRKPGEFAFGRPVNARWVKSEKGAIATITFDPERVSPKDLSGSFSPFLDEVFKLPLEIHQAFAREEGMRRAWRDAQWPWIQKLIVHFDNRNKALFDKEANIKKTSPHAASWATRLRLLYKLLENAFDNFTVNRLPQIERVRQRIAFAQSVSTNLYVDLVRLYVMSSRMVKIWTELNKIRTAFLKSYLTMSPLLKMQIYWSKPPKDLSEYVVPDKQFDELKQLYIESFETLCRLTVIALALEAIIHHRTLSISTKKRQISIWDYEAMPNANKYTVLQRYPIHDLFLPAMDSKLRNGIGHHSAFYSPDADEVVYYEQQGKDLVKCRISYTEFVDKVLVVYSVVELAALYFHPIHVKGCEIE